VELFVICPSPLPLKQEITTNKHLARDFQNIQSQIAAEKTDSPKKAAVKVLTMPTVCVCDIIHV